MEKVICDKADILGCSSQLCCHAEPHKKIYTCYERCSREKSAKCVAVPKEK